MTANPKRIILADYRPKVVPRDLPSSGVVEELDRMVEVDALSSKLADADRNLKAAARTYTEVSDALEAALYKL